MKKKVIKVNSFKKKIAVFEKKINKRLPVVALVLLLCLLASGQAFASADGLWQTVAGLIETWVTRLGGVVMFVGGIMFGLGWKSDDAEQKSRGIQTLVAGAIVAAVAALTGQFFA